MPIDHFLNLYGIGIAMSTRMDHRVSRRIIQAAVCILLAVLIITVLRQYSVYHKERNILFISEFRIRDKLRRAKMKEQDFENLVNERAKAERQLTQLHALLPEKIGVDGFLDRFSAFAKEFSVQIHNTQVEKKNRDFYVEALIRMTLHGSEKNVRGLTERQLKEKRLTSWKTFREGENTFTIEIHIYAINEWKPKKIDIEKTMCPEFETKVWLWPFKGKIEKMHQELDDLCKRSQDHFEALKRIEELADKRQNITTGVEILRELEKKRTLPSFAN